MKTLMQIKLPRNLSSRHTLVLVVIRPHGEDIIQTIGKLVSYKGISGGELKQSLWSTAD